MTEALERVDELVAAHDLHDAPGAAELRTLARRRAEAAFADGQVARGEHVHTALLFHAADVLALRAIELAADRERASGLIGELCSAAGVSRQALARELLRDSSLLGFPPAVAIEVQLGLLMALAPLRELSLWMADSSGAPQVVCHVGAPPDGCAAQELAGRLLGGKAPHTQRGELVGLAVKRWHEHAGALVGRMLRSEPAGHVRRGELAGRVQRDGRAQRSELDRCEALIEEALPALGTILERETLMRRNVSAEHTLSQTHERRLTRLGLDIHDGPLQDLALLGEDVQLLRRQLSDVLGEELHEIMLGRLDDLQAQLLALDSDLRRISASLQSPFSGRQSLREGLSSMARAFAARCEIEPALHVEGDLDDLTDSQQMALLSIVRETLSNVREHSDASHVSVSLRGGPLSLELHVSDDGSGFDVEQALVRAAREGRFGLIGLHERARLLGGSSHIDSRPGQPTTISVTLPRWKALAPQDAQEA